MGKQEIRWMYVLISIPVCAWLAILAHIFGTQAISLNEFSPSSDATEIFLRYRIVAYLIALTALLGSVIFAFRKPPTKIIVAFYLIVIGITAYMTMDFVDRSYQAIEDSVKE